MVTATSVHTSAAQQGQPNTSPAETGSCWDTACKIATLAAIAFVVISVFALLPLPLTFIAAVVVLWVGSSLYSCCFRPYVPVCVRRYSWPATIPVYAHHPREFSYGFPVGNLFASHRVPAGRGPGSFPSGGFGAAGRVPVGGGHVGSSASAFGAGARVPVGGGHVGSSASAFAAGARVPVGTRPA